MREAYVIAFIVTALILGACVVGAAGSERRIAVAVKKILIAALYSVVANIVVVISQNELVCTIGYSLFSIGIIWLLYYVFHFILQYAGNEHPMLYNKKLMILFLMADTVSMILNIFLHHAFECEAVLTESGELFYRITENYLAYDLHLILSYLLVVMGFATLIYKIIKSPSMYRGKYLLVLLILAMIVLGDAAYVFLGEIIDGSILFFAAGGVIVYYYSVIYEPRELLERTLSMVVKEMHDAVFVFDINGRYLHGNERAERMRLMKNTENEEDLFAKVLKGRDVKEEENFVSDVTIRRDGKEMHMQVQFHRIEDKKKRYVGCFFVVHDHTEEINKLEREHYRATHDSLTGLYNKEFFYEKAKECLDENPDKEFLMVCSDVGDFKLVNDIFGTEAGDQLLVRIAEAMQEQTIPGEVYCRLENDRFALLMQKKDYKEKVFTNGPKEVSWIDSDISYPLNIYVGVYEIVDRTIPVSVMCGRAFMAVNTIKGNYQKHVAYYDDALREKVLWEQQLTGEINTAIKERQFQMYLQPQVQKDGSVSGAEALVRWVHPEHGMIMPGDFIPVFERNGMIIKLDQYIWETACIRLKKWKEQGITDKYISVNISPKDFYFLDIYKVFDRLVEQYEIDPGNLKIEITETAVMMDLEKQLKLIEKLRNRGFVVEMDDFGSGYSSLNMLKDISVDILKVDMAFLRKTDNEERSREILKSMIGLSTRLGMPVITEGVETEEQVQFLKEVGCTMFQGYYFAKPMPVEEFEAAYIE